MPDPTMRHSCPASSRGVARLAHLEKGSGTAYPISGRAGASLIGFAIDVVTAAAIDAATDAAIGVAIVAVTVVVIAAVIAAVIVAAIDAVTDGLSTFRTSSIYLRTSLTIVSQCMH